jgi:hypothetical protein
MRQVIDGFINFLDKDSLAHVFQFMAFNMDRNARWSKTLGRCNDQKDL